MFENEATCKNELDLHGNELVRETYFHTAGKVAWPSGLGRSI